MYHNLSDSITVSQSLLPAARTNGTVNGTTVDLLGFSDSTAIAEFGTWTDGTHTAKLQDSPDNSAWTDCVAADLDGAFVAISAAPGANAIQKVGYKGSKRYVRLVMTTSGATTGALSGGVVVKSRPRHIGAIA